MGNISLKRSWIIWGCAALFFCYQFMLRVSPSVMVQELMTDFHVDAYALGLLTSFYYYGYVSMQLPIGAMLDKWGPRVILTTAAFVCCLASIVFSQSATVEMASVSRFLIGCASAAGFLSCMKLATVWFPPQKISMVIGFTLLLGTTGAMSGSAPLSLLMEQMSWRDTIWITSIIGACLCVISWLLVRDNAPKKLANKIAEHHEVLQNQPTVLKTFYIVASKRQAWVIAAYGMMMYIPLAAFADMWGVPFLMAIHNFDKQTAAIATSAMYMGIGIGTPLLSVVADRTKQYKPALWLGSMGAFTLFCLTFYLPGLSATTVTGFMFAAGMCLGGQFIAYSVVTEINPVEVAGSASAFQNMVCLTSGIIFQPVIGLILKLSWDGTITAGTPQYADQDYQYAMMLIPLALAIASFISVRLIKEVYPNHDFSNNLQLAKE